MIRCVRCSSRIDPRTDMNVCHECALVVRPKCRCHGEDMGKAGHRKSGRQVWTCRRKRVLHNASKAARACRARYQRTEKGRASQKRVRDRYDNSEHGKAVNAARARRHVESGLRARISERFRYSDKGREALYRQRRKELKQRIESKRTRIDEMMLELPPNVRELLKEDA